MTFVEHDDSNEMSCIIPQHFSFSAFQTWEALLNGQDVTTGAENLPDLSALSSTQLEHLEANGGGPVLCKKMCCFFFTKKTEW